MINIVTPEELEQMPDWCLQLDQMTLKYGIQADEIYDVIYGETFPKWNFASFNAKTQAAGAFQFIPATLDWIADMYGFEYTVDDVLAMTPAEQLVVYDMYLEGWRYEGDVPLGFMQAAPGTYWNLKKVGEPIIDDLTVYDAGSGAANRNPGWQTADGAVTIGSIRDYYAKPRGWRD